MGFDPRMERGLSFANNLKYMYEQGQIQDGFTGVYVFESIDLVTFIVTELRLSGFEVEQNGLELKIVSYDAANAPMRIMEL